MTGRRSALHSKEIVHEINPRLRCLTMMVVNGEAKQVVLHLRVTMGHPTTIISCSTLGKSATWGMERVIYVVAQDIMIESVLPGKTNPLEFYLKH